MLLLFRAVPCKVRGSLVRSDPCTSRRREVARYTRSSGLWVRDPFRFAFDSLSGIITQHGHVHVMYDPTPKAVEHTKAVELKPNVTHTAPLSLTQPKHTLEVVLTLFTSSPLNANIIFQHTRETEQLRCQDSGLLDKSRSSARLAAGCNSLDAASLWKHTYSTALALRRPRLFGLGPGLIFGSVIMWSRHCRRCALRLTW